jgi:hypothetical protein
MLRRGVLELLNRDDLENELSRVGLMENKVADYKKAIVDLLRKKYGVRA